MGEEFYSSKNTMIRKREIMTREMYEEMGLIDDEMDWHEWSLKLSHLLFDMTEISEFQDLVRRMYMELMKGRGDELIREIAEEVKRIERVVVADEGKWEGEGFSREVEAMQEWIHERYEYFDEVYGGDEVMLVD